MHAVKRPRHQPQQRATPFVVGQITPIGKIVGVIAGKTLMTTRYEVERACCGEVSVLRYKELRSREYQQPKHCRRCASREKALKQNGVQMRTHRPLRTPGARDAIGYFWPFLGKMGPRFGLAFRQLHYAPHHD